MTRSRSGNLNIRKIFRETDFCGKTALALSTWFGVGLLPVSPGTFGTLAAVPLVSVLVYLGMWYGAFVLVLVALIAIWTSGRTEALLGRSDPPEVVIDEVEGFLLTMFLLPSSWLALGLGFVLFRFFDILKPYPIKQVEQKLTGGLGIVMDDVLAGLCAHASVRILLLFLT